MSHFAKISSRAWISAAVLLVCTACESEPDNYEQVALRNQEPSDSDVSMQMGGRQNAGFDAGLDAGLKVRPVDKPNATSTDGEADPQDDPNPALDLVRGCEVGDPSAREACASMLNSATGVEIEFGPRGAIMDFNVGGGIFSTDSDTAASGLICPFFTRSFGEDPVLLDRLLDTTDLDLSLFTIYRPASMKDGETFPVISWGNGTCAQPEGYGPLLRHLASHGFIVVSPNSRFVGNGSEMVLGLDLIESLNQDNGSPLFGRVDMDKVGVMGHSQGSSGARAAADDPRVKSVILWNGGSSHDKPYLAVSAEMDLGNVTAQSMADALQAPGAYIFFHDPFGMGGIRGHLTLMLEPERVLDLNLNFWRMTLLDDPAAAAWFGGDNCDLCTPGGASELRSYDFGSTGF